VLATPTVASLEHGADCPDPLEAVANDAPKNVLAPEEEEPITSDVPMEGVLERGPDLNDDVDDCVPCKVDKPSTAPGSVAELPPNEDC
jgi:hypothetical protein